MKTRRKSFVGGLSLVSRILEITWKEMLFKPDSTKFMIFSITSNRLSDRSHIVFS